MDLSKQFSPRSSARLAGLIYLIVIVGGGFAEAFVRQRLVTPGDANATAAAIQANEPLMRVAFAADIIPLLLNMLLAAILYQLFKVVSERGALTAVFFALASSAVQATAMAFHFASLVVLRASPALSAFDAAQLEQLSYLFLRLHAHTYTIALLFFGGGALTIGFLLLGSRFMPRLLGLLMCLAGLCYLTNSMLYFVAPEFASIALLLPALLGEGGLTLWFLIVGVNATAWRKQAGLEAQQALAVHP